jgi:ABC-type nitrate/sulfonate/bicarbonate transport system substrate-binding protein
MKIICRLALIAFFVSASAPALDAAEKIRVAVTNPNMSFLPSQVALKKGFFKDEGLDVEIIRMNVPNIVTALVTGDIGYTLLFGSVVRGALRGMPMRALATLLDGSTHALVANRAKSLKGKPSGSATSVARTRWRVA